MHRFFLHPMSQRMARIVAIILVCAFALRIYFNLRGFSSLWGYSPPPPLAPGDLTRFEFYQMDIGFFLQMAIVPVALINLLTVIPYFRQLFQDQTAPHATLGVLAGLIAIQIASQSYDIWLTRVLQLPFFVGFLVIFIGSLLGGWRIGLPLGVVSMLFQGTYELLTAIPTVSPTYTQTASWGWFLLTHYGLFHFSVGVWVAVLACLSADALGRYRYSPLAAMGLVTGLVITTGYIHLVAGETPGLAETPSQALITGLAAGVVMLILRNLQVDAARRKTEAAELIRVQAELRALRAQINPHFLFNALNTIRYTIRTNPNAARRLLLDLSEVFQRTLQSGEFISLRDELSYVEAYLALEKARLGDRLRVVWGGVLQPEMPLQTETELLDQPVPTLALQPIVENAVIHGISKKKEGGTVTVTVGPQNDDLVITVEDDGIGISPIQLSELLKPGETRSSIGLCNVDGRLRLLYGADYRLDIESDVGRGTRVAIRIPLQET